jgi:hypothetical protein
MNKSIFILILVFICVVVGCKKKCSDEPCYDRSNPQCENYDPCYGKQPVSADFIIGNYSFGIKFKNYPFAYVEDSIFSQVGIGNSLLMYFEAKQKGAHYTWYLGSEVITDSVFTRSFQGSPMGKYTVTLIVEKTPDLRCFPNDDGIDTMVKSFWIVPAYDLPLIGKYKVLFEGQEDSSIIQVQPWHSRDNVNWPVQDSMNKYHIVLINFGNVNDTIGSAKIPSSTSYTGNHMYYQDDENNGNTLYYTASNGELHLNKNKIEAHYDYLRKQMKFKGRKL